MKKKVLFSVLCLVLMMIALPLVNAIVPGVTYADIQVSMMSQDPDPADPGGYVDIRWKVANNGTQTLPDAVFEILPKYPFSLDPGESAIKDTAGLWGLQRGEEGLILHYKLRIDKDAVEGRNEIDLRYNTCGEKDCWISDTYNVEIDNAQTDFDMVAQEISGNDVSVAIANTGENIANSIIVKFPEQENFKVIGPSGQMVGNLENGDYTLVSFQIAPKQKVTGVQTIKFQIDYTDNIGKRRILLKDVPVDMSSLTGGNFTFNGGNVDTSSNRTRQVQLSIYQQWWFWAIIIAAAYLMYLAYKIYKRKKEGKEEGKHKGKND